MSALQGPLLSHCAVHATSRPLAAFHVRLLKALDESSLALLHEVLDLDHLELKDCKGCCLLPKKGLSQTRSSLKGRFRESMLNCRALHDISRAKVK